MPFWRGPRPCAALGRSLVCWRRLRSGRFVDLPSNLPSSPVDPSLVATRLGDPPPPLRQVHRPATEMGGRFLLEKLSHSSRSRNLLGAHFSSASALLIRSTASDAAPTLGNHLRGLSAHPSTAVLSNQVIHGSVARYYSTFSFSCPAAKTRSPTTGMSSIVAHPMKPAFVDSVRGPKRTFSSEIIKHDMDWEAERAKMEAELEAIKKISRSADVEAEIADVRAEFEHCKAFLENLTDTSNAELAAWREEMDKDAAKFERFLNGILCVLAGLVAYGLYLVHCGIESHHQRLVAARANAKDQNP